LFLLTDALVR